MRKHPVATGLAVLTITLGLGFLMGPKAEKDETLHPMNLPTDLDGYLAEQEARFNDLTPGTEKTLIWAGSTGVKTPLSVVYIHGYSATRQEAAPLADSVAAALGANLFYTRLTGHGRGSAAMMDGTVNAWLNDAWEAFEIGRRIGERVVLISVSTGGTLAAWLVTQDDVQDLAANVMISPNFKPSASGTGLLTLPWGAQIADAVAPEEYSWEPSNELQGRYWTTTYPIRALIPMMALVEIANDAPLELNTTPTFVIYSQNDTVVDPEATEHAFARLGGEKKIMTFEEAEDRSSHVLAGAILSPTATPKLTREIVQFIQEEVLR